MIINHLIKSETIESDSLDWLITIGATGTTTVAAKFSDTFKPYSNHGGQILPTIAVDFPVMAVRVVEFSSVGYKIRKIFS